MHRAHAAGSRAFLPPPASRLLLRTLPHPLVAALLLPTGGATFNIYNMHDSHAAGGSALPPLVPASHHLLLHPLPALHEASLLVKQRAHTPKHMRICVQLTCSRR
jgi:hypothetical protein